MTQTPDTRQLVTDRFELTLPEFQDRVDVRVITAALQKLNTYAAHLSLDNNFLGTATFGGGAGQGRTVIGFNGWYTQNPAGTTTMSIDGTSGGMSMQGSLVVGGNLSSGNISAAQINASGPIISASYIVAATSLSANSGWLYLHPANSVWVSWNGGQIVTSHSLVVGGGGVYFNGSTAYGLYWNGGGFQFTHYVISGGGLYLSGNGGIGFAWDGNIRSTHALNIPRLIVADWDAGQSGNFAGSVVAAGYFYQRGSTAYRCWDNADFNFSVPAYGNYLVQRDGSGGIQTADIACGAIRAVGRVVVNQYDGGAQYGLSVGGASIFSGGDVVSHNSYRLDANPPGVISWYGGAGISWGPNIGRGTDNLYLYNSVYTFWDNDCGHHMHAQEFVSSSRSASKAAQEPLADADALDRIRDPRVQAITWQEPPLPEHVEGVAAEYAAERMVPPDWHSPARHVGFTADDMALVVPEVVSTDDQGPSGIAYANLTALLWGAVRELDRRLAQLEPKEDQAA